MHYVVLLMHRDARADSASGLGQSIAATVRWLEELRQAGVLLARGAAVDPPLEGMLAAGALQGCLVLSADRDDDAHALAATCPADAHMHTTVIRLVREPVAPLGGA